MSVRSLILFFVVVLWLWPAVGYGQPPELREATSLNYLAELYHTQGRYSEAEPLHKRALAIRARHAEQNPAN